MWFNSGFLVGFLALTRTFGLVWTWRSELSCCAEIETPPHTHTDTDTPYHSVAVKYSNVQQTSTPVWLPYARPAEAYRLHISHKLPTASASAAGGASGRSAAALLPGPLSSQRSPANLLSVWFWWYGFQTRLGFAFPPGKQSGGGSSLTVKAAWWRPRLQISMLMFFIVLQNWLHQSSLKSLRFYQRREIGKKVKKFPDSSKEMSFILLFLSFSG